MRIPVIFCVAAAALIGCYTDRMTSNYNDVFEVTNTDDDSAVIDESGRTAEDEARIRKRLMELEMEEEPAYHMNAGDQVEIRVYDHPDLGITTRIGPDGMVGMAFMGQVKLSGQTIAQGAECIREGLAPYVKNPVVSITVLDVQSAAHNVKVPFDEANVDGLNFLANAEIHQHLGARAVVAQVGRES